VPLFFILSGFILSHTYFSRYKLKEHGHFVFLRFARLWPVHAAAIITLTCYLLLVALHAHKFPSDSSFSFHDLPAEALMVRCWFSKALLWNFPAWSIQSEWFAYLFLFPIAFLAFHRTQNPWFPAISAVFLVVVHSFLPLQSIPGKCMDIVCLFLAGSALFRLRVLLPGRRGHFCVTIGLVFLGLGLFFAHVFSSLAIHAGFALIIFGLSYSRGVWAEILSHPWLVYGGTISYSLYMTHAVAGKFYGLISSRIHPASLASGCLCLGLLLLGILAFAMLFYHLVEAPWNLRLRRLWKDREQRQPVIGRVPEGQLSK
jgi:peptidoglycan/LPS O-acetylase OafA/YrhL